MRSSLLLATSLLALLAAPVAARAREPRSGLVLCTDASTTPAMTAITGGLRKSVFDGWDGPVTFVGPSRFPLCSPALAAGLLGEDRHA